MIDRRMIGDVAIAFLLAVPTIALSRPQPASVHPSVTSPLAETSTFADDTTVEQSDLR